MSMNKDIDFLKGVFGLELEVFGATDVGCVRELNEDAFCIDPNLSEKGQGFCVLADGMGGHNAGEIASRTAVEIISQQLRILLDSGGDEIPAAINAAIGEANREIFDMAVRNQEQQGMGTTAVVTCIAGDEAYIANVGDSRAYAVRGEEILQITTDHSVVAEMVAQGTISKEEARVHPQKNIITRALGTDESVEADIFEYDFQPGDILMMCSDGLSGMMEDEAIRDVCMQETSAEQMVHRMIQCAKENGGMDNVTVLCIRFI